MTNPEVLPFGASATLWWPIGDCSQPDVWALFRADVTLAGPISLAGLRLYAKDAYRLWVNGAVLGGGPCLSAPPLLYWDAWDLTGHVPAGRNIIAVQVHHVGHTAPAGFRFAGFRAALVARQRLGRGADLALVPTAELADIFDC